MRGTIRAQHEEVRRQLAGAISRIARGASELHGVGVHVEINNGTPSLINKKDMIDICQAAATNVVGEENVVPLRIANMGGEDFAYFMQEIPGAYVRYGAQRAGKESFPAHSSKFDFDEDVLEIGARYLAEVAVKAGVTYREGH